MIKVVDLCKRFGNKEVLKKINFEVNSCEVFVLLGPNGAGKTTTIKILAGILEADSGEVYILGEKMSVLNTKLKKHIGYLPDEPYIYPKLTGKEFIEFVFSIYEKELENEKYKFFLSQFELEDAINLPIETYSKGMKQKLLLMSIFLREPDLYLLDEPLVGLDPKSISFFKKYITELKNKGKTIILCTHLLDLAEQLSTKIAIIYDGRVIIYGSKQYLSEYLNVFSDSLEDIYIKVTQNKIYE
ncbi:MAG: ABC transporter ATP-binding protein [Elusimicrobiota bacterium]|nr:ABC transporter ATP-binding protein [Endomicrobiia bacterium]MDW8165544.1 ABC transporter ATP-binding protein [Elusimicrobiota bacterium]